MKNSVNGKTFDEIILQRGSHRERRLIKGHIYLYQHSPRALALFEHDHAARYHKIAKTALILYPSGETLYTENNRVKAYHRVPITGKFFEATPDQIALLESYKNQE